jgi:hypothetical protein
MGKMRIRRPVKNLGDETRPNFEEGSVFSFFYIFYISNIYIVYKSIGYHPFLLRMCRSRKALFWVKKEINAKRKPLRCSRGGTS